VGERRERGALSAGSDGARTRAVLLDRDGVLNDPVHDPVDGTPESPLRAEDVVLAEGAAEGCRALLDAGLRLGVVSNQPAAAKGKATLQDLRAVHERVVELLGAEGVTIGTWHYCHHHPEAVVATLRGPCDCRKPAPGMLLAAAHDLGVAPAACWMAGDGDADMEAGRAAGCRTLLVEHPLTAHRRARAVPGDAGARNLWEGTVVILGTVR
jgi:D-glycero-D-manno-heptose 1,7-bisphosphate phosphatase